MNRIPLTSWVLWISVSLALSVYVLPAIVSDSSGSLVLAAIVWFILFAESRQKGFGTEERTICRVLHQLSMRGAKEGDSDKRFNPHFEASLDYLNVRKLGPLVFPKKLWDGWMFLVSVSALVGAEKVIFGWIDQTTFMPELYDFGYVAESIGLVFTAMAFWARHNLGHHNWRMRRDKFDEISKYKGLTPQEKARVWQECLAADLVTNDP